ncbi:conserved virulence factor C family protein [Pseudogracilibacillus sp. SE30717A]|uniref:conserved virulence factor C family protein n=1 Tax=Pseudogracilibacillus sp. SE30717A TaxID=3098293 RepID=UPI00300DD907
MKIVSMEPTPSPYSMKINLDEQLPNGKSENYKQDDDLGKAPKYVQQLFSIHGVKGLYRVIDFITLERNPRVAWEEILPQVREVLGSEQDTTELFSKAVENTEDSFGEIHVFIQMFRTIPLQVKLQEGEKEQRFALPERFMKAGMEAAVASEHFLVERKWVEQSPRYGEIEEAGNAIVEEISATYSEERLDELVKRALNNETLTELPKKKVTLDMLDQPNWRDRYAALAQMDPTEADFPVLNKALDDNNSSIRRLATAYLGMIEEPETLPYLYKALKDKSVNVRRTAGDCLSDLGFKEAIPEMIQALSDRSRIVRWRAAMFLYEIGDETAITVLEKVLDDPEFEVRMQAKMALARIQSGQKAEGSIWKQMEQATKE